MRKKSKSEKSELVNEADNSLGLSWYKPDGSLVLWNPSYNKSIKTKFTILMNKMFKLF